MARSWTPAALCVLAIVTNVTILVASTPGVHAQGGRKSGSRETAAQSVAPLAPANFSPVSDVMGSWKGAERRTVCVLGQDWQEDLYRLTLASPEDTIRLSKGPEGPGTPTGSVFRADSERNNCDPITRMVLGDSAANAFEKNIKVTVCRMGAAYTRLNASLPGAIGRLCAPHLRYFIGSGARIRFSSDSWVRLGDKSYRDGGITISDDSIDFLPNTTVRSTEGDFVFSSGKWRRVPSAAR